MGGDRTRHRGTPRGTLRGHTGGVPPTPRGLPPGDCELFQQAWLLGKEVGGAQSRHPGLPPRGSTGTYRRGPPIPPGIPPRGLRTFPLRSEGLDARQKGGRGPDSTPRYPPGHSTGTYRRGPPDPPGAPPRGLRTLSAGLVARQGGGRGPISTSWVTPTGLYRDIPEGSPHTGGKSILRENNLETT